MNRWILAAASVVLIAILANYFWYRDVPPCLEPASTMSDFDELAYQMLLDMNKYLISLATLLLGSLGAIGLKFHTLAHAKDRLQARTVLSIAGLFGIASLYFAFDSHVGLAEAAINKCAEFGSKLAVAQYLQFGALIIGLTSTLYLMFRFLNYERLEE